MKQLRGTSVSVDIVASYFADEVCQADTYFVLIYSFNIL